MSVPHRTQASYLRDHRSVMPCKRLCSAFTICKKALDPADATSDANLGVLVALLGNLVTALVGFFVSQRRK